jgi:GT2 family glycosyltransferase
MYLEDMDVCARVGKAGRTAWYLPGALVRHPGGQCSRLSPVRRLLKALEEGQAPWLLLRLYQGPGAAARYAAAVLAGSLFRSGACLALLALARLTGRDGERLEAQLDAAKALLVWSLSPKKDFHRRLDSHFADRPAPGALDGLEAPEARQ